VARFRGSSQGRSIRSPRRRSSWEAGPGGTAALGLTGAATTSFIGSAVSPTTPGVTAVRLRGQIDFMLTLATAAGDGFQGAVGIGIATEAAVMAGIASVPTPITEQGDENWLWWHVFSVHNPVVSSSGITRSGFQRVVVDSKAMRKLDDGMSLYWAIELVETGTATMTVRADSRVLILLP